MARRAIDIHNDPRPRLVCCAPGCGLTRFVTADYRNTVSAAAGESAWTCAQNTGDEAHCGCNKPQEPPQKDDDVDMHIDAEYVENTPAKARAAGKAAKAWIADVAPPGWTHQLRTRKKGLQAGQVYSQFFSPEGKLYRSRKEVLSVLGIVGGRSAPRAASGRKRKRAGSEEGSDEGGDGEGSGDDGFVPRGGLRSKAGGRPKPSIKASTEKVIAKSILKAAQEKEREVVKKAKALAASMAAEKRAVEKAQAEQRKREKALEARERRLGISGGAAGSGLEEKAGCVVCRKPYEDGTHQCEGCNAWCHADCLHFSLDVRPTRSCCNP